MNSFYSLFVLWRSGIKYFGQFQSYDALLEFLSLEFQKESSLGEQEIPVEVYIDYHEKDGFYV